MINFGRIKKTTLLFCITILLSYPYIGNASNNQSNNILKVYIEYENSLKEYRDYERMNENTKDKKIISELNKKKNKLLSIEKKYFYKNNNITVHGNSQNFYFYKDLKKTYIYTNKKGSPVDEAYGKKATKQYKVCFSDNLNNCFQNNNSLFESEFPLIELNKMIFPYKPAESDTFIKDNIVYGKHKGGYFEETKGLFNNTMPYLGLYFFDINNSKKEFWYGKYSHKELIITSSDNDNYIGVVSIKPLLKLNGNDIKGKKIQSLLHLINKDKFYYDNIDKNILIAIQQDIKDNNIKNIKDAYNHIKDMVEYDYDAYYLMNEGKELPKERDYISSGLGLFQNKKGICSGYASLLGYYAYYLGHKNIKVEEGFVVGDDGSLELHAWSLIDGKYYDLTFDDTGTFKRINNYFGLTKKEMYADRINVNDTVMKDKIFKMDIGERQNWKLENKINTGRQNIIN